jgi:Papain family cysteine protease
MKKQTDNLITASREPSDRVIELDNRTFLNDVRNAIRATGARWTAGETAVSRLPAEVRASMLSPTPFSPVLPPQPFLGPLPLLPESFDWTNVDGSNYVTPAKMQDGGTCAAYSSTAALESCVLRMGLSHDPNLNLAEHAIIGTIGGGGNLHAIAAFMQTTGLPLESWYPGDPATAVQRWQSHTYRQVSWDCLYPSVVEEVKAFIIQNGPVVTTMNCPPDFFAYRSGVYSNVHGQPGGFHAILVVGYNDAEHCFIVKNSWDTNWGQAGFGKIDYCEFRSSLVNFGWDIHTYTRAEPPPLDTYVSVPLVVGLRRHTVATIITSAGLKCKFTGVTTSPNSRVFSQNPRGGEKVKKGTLVTCRCNTNLPA